MDQKLTILFVPMNELGHISPMIGFAQNLLPKHRIVFAVSQKSAGQLKKYGFEEVVYHVDNPYFNLEKNRMKQSVEDKKLDYNKPPIEIMKAGIKRELFLNLSKSTDPHMKQIVEQVKPDLVILDSMFILPSAIKDRPWINLITPSPNVMLFDERCPPPGLGLSSNDPSSWTELAEELKSISLPYFKKHNQWYEDNGLPRNPNQCQRIYPSPYLNIYHYPLEIDYTDLRPNPPNWLRMNTFMIKPNEEFVIPEKLKKLPGKLIYFSLGSIISRDIDVMKKLVNYLSSSPHRFIVSKGMFGEEYDLPDNCWGDNVIPQTEVLKVVDLAIIHGGNNSLCEAFYFGKPMIVMPLFGDQNDNAQRVQDKGFGFRLNPFCCTKEELLDAIEQLVNDENLKKRMKLIAERCERESKTNKIVEIVEDVVKRSKQK